jgi:signal transduction histidine kinase
MLNEDARDAGHEQAAAVTTIEEPFSSGEGVEAPPAGRPDDVGPTPARGHSVGDGDRLARLHERLAAGLPSVARPLLDGALVRAERLNAAAGDGDDGLRLAATEYAADAVGVLAAEGILEPSDAQAAVDGLAAAAGMRVEPARLELYRRAASSDQLLELPPLVAAGIQLRLLSFLGVAEDVSLWRRSPGGGIDCLVDVGDQPPSRRMRAEAKAALRPRTVRLVSRASIRSARIRRLGRLYAVIVARAPGHRQRQADAYLEVACAAVGAVLDREHLLERSTTREQALVTASERRLMRLGFDLHDGPVQDVLALANELSVLRDQAYPFLLESHRELVAGRFDDALLRLRDIDRQLREIAHSLESRSVVSRPLGEILHRDAEGFEDRTGISVHLEIRGDAESLSSAQRVAVFRAIQEALSNVREHSGASRVDILVRARRSSVEVRVRDDGTGFEVERALARAAQRGRLGLVGIGERVCMLGGTFDVDSAPGGPTVLTFSLPRWEPLAPTHPVP